MSDVIITASAIPTTIISTEVIGVIGHDGAQGPIGKTDNNYSATFLFDTFAKIPCNTVMTIGQGNAPEGTGTLAYAKSTAAAPGTYTATTLPATLEAGSWLRVTATGVVDGLSFHLIRVA